MSAPSFVSERDGAALVRVRVTPGAHADAIVGERSGALLVRIGAPPVDGRANRALCRLLAGAAAVPKGRASVVRGAAARDKLVRIEGVSAAELSSRLGA